MAYRTINLKPGTYQRLQNYKVAGRSFDEVLNVLMDKTGPEEVFEDVLQEHRRRLTRIEARRFRFPGKAR